MALVGRMIRIDRRCLRKFLINFIWKGIWGYRRFKKRKKKGELFPAFQFISVTDACNLRCQGCWVTKGKNTKNIDMDSIRKIIEESKKQGSYFFGILGGEPLMYEPLFDIFKAFPNCYFQLFTNGTLLNNEIANKIKKCANVTPLISFEGDELVADVRRGGKQIYKQTLEAIEISSNNKLVTGVAISVCKSNIDMALSDDFVKMLWKKGALYLWYYIYRPSGLNPCYELALGSDEIERVRKFIVYARKKYSLIIIDSYWDAKGEPFCPAAEGLSHHINPYGYIEPCPVIQFADCNIKDNNLKPLYENSLFLKEFRRYVSRKTNGCIYMEDPSWLHSFAVKHHAVNTSNRDNLFQQLLQAPILNSHASCNAYREMNWAYRFAKKRAFLGLGAYG